MHFLKRSTSFARFQIVGKFAFSEEEYQKNLLQNSFRDPDPHQEESLGWVSPQNCLQPPELQEMLSEPYLKLSMRVDKKRIPKALWIAHLAIEERAVLESSGRKKLSINERRELKQSVKEFLLERAAPASSLYQALWNFSSGMCFLFSTSRGVQAQFCKLFRDTFSLDMQPLTPWALAHFWAQNNNAIATLETVEPSSFQK